MKVDAQIEEECRRTVYLLSARVFLPKASLQETESSETYDEYSSHHKKTEMKVWHSLLVTFLIRELCKRPPQYDPLLSLS